MEHPELFISVLFAVSTRSFKGVGRPFVLPCFRKRENSAFLFRAFQFHKDNTKQYSKLQREKSMHLQPHTENSRQLSKAGSLGAREVVLPREGHTN